jgi:hypothetical protein
MGSKPAEVANMPITTERSNTYDTTHVMIATPTAGEHAARPPPPQLTGVSARQQGMLVKMFAKATGMVGFDVGALYVEDYGYVTVFQSGWLAAAAVNGDLEELGGNQPWRGVHERGHGPGDG